METAVPYSLSFEIDAASEASEDPAAAAVPFRRNDDRDCSSSSGLTLVMANTSDVRTDRMLLAASDDDDDAPFEPATAAGSNSVSVKSRYPSSNELRDSPRTTVLTSGRLLSPNRQHESPVDRSDEAAGNSDSLLVERPTADPPQSPNNVAAAPASVDVSVDPRESQSTEIVPQVPSSFRVSDSDTNEARNESSVLDSMSSAHTNATMTSPCPSAVSGGFYGSILSVQQALDRRCPSPTDDDDCDDDDAPTPWPLTRMDNSHKLKAIHPPLDETQSEDKTERTSNTRSCQELRSIDDSATLEEASDLDDGDSVSLDGSEYQSFSGTPSRPSGQEQAFDCIPIQDRQGESTVSTPSESVDRILPIVSYRSYDRIIAGSHLAHTTCNTTAATEVSTRTTDDTVTWHAVSSRSGRSTMSASRTTASQRRRHHQPDFDDDSDSFADSRHSSAGIGIRPCSSEARQALLPATEYKAVASAHRTNTSVNPELVEQQLREESEQRSDQIVPEVQKTIAIEATADPIAVMDGSDEAAQKVSASRVSPPDSSPVSQKNRRIFIGLTAVCLLFAFVVSAGVAAAVNSGFRHDNVSDANHEQPSASDRAGQGGTDTTMPIDAPSSDELVARLFRMDFTYAIVVHDALVEYIPRKDYAEDLVTMMDYLAVYALDRTMLNEGQREKPESAVEVRRPTVIDSITQVDCLQGGELYAGATLSTDRCEQIATSLKMMSTGNRVHVKHYFAEMERLLMSREHPQRALQAIDPLTKIDFIGLVD